MTLEQMIQLEQLVGGLVDDAVTEAYSYKRWVAIRTLAAMVLLKAGATAKV